MSTTFSLKYENSINIFRQKKSEVHYQQTSLPKILLRRVFRRKINDTRRNIVGETLTIIYNLEAHWICDILYSKQWPGNITGPLRSSRILPLPYQR